MDEGCTVNVIYLDFAMAFDSVKLTCLLAKMAFFIIICHFVLLSDITVAFDLQQEELHDCISNAASFVITAANRERHLQQPVHFTAELSLRKVTPSMQFVFVRFFNNHICIGFAQSDLPTLSSCLSSKEQSQYLIGFLFGIREVTMQ